VNVQEPFPVRNQGPASVPEEQLSAGIFDRGKMGLAGGTSLFAIDHLCSSTKTAFVMLYENI
jgi:hypothetical protein